MIRAYRLYTGPDGNSHVVHGRVDEGQLVEAQSILFKETPPHSAFDWHNDPIPQYVITLPACSNLPPLVARHSRSALSGFTGQREVFKILGLGRSAWHGSWRPEGVVESTPR
jgi:hypothetical protein